MVRVARAMAVGGGQLSWFLRQNGTRWRDEEEEGRLTSDEQMELAGGEIGQFRAQGAPAVPQAASLLAHGPGVVGAQGHEDGQADDLEAEAGDHDVNACLLQGPRVGGVGQGAADGLQDEGEEVAADENDGVGAGFEAGDGFAVDKDDAREGEVDGGGEEAGSYGEDDDVPVVFIVESRSAIPAWASFFFLFPPCN